MDWSGRERGHSRIDPGSGVELQVVDESRFAQARGREHHELFRVGTRRLEGSRVAHAEVVCPKTRPIERRATASPVPLPTFADGLAVMRCMDAMRASAAAGGALQTIDER